MLLSKVTYSSLDQAGANPPGEIDNYNSAPLIVKYLKDPFWDPFYFPVIYDLGVELNPAKVQYLYHGTIIKSGKGLFTDCFSIIADVSLN